RYGDHTVVNQARNRGSNRGSPREILPCEGGLAVGTIIGISTEVAGGYGRERRVAAGQRGGAEGAKRGKMSVLRRWHAIGVFCTFLAQIAGAIGHLIIPLVDKYFCQLYLVGVALRWPRQLNGAVTSCARPQLFLV